MHAGRDRDRPRPRARASRRRTCRTCSTASTAPTPRGARPGSGPRPGHRRAGRGDPRGHGERGDRRGRRRGVDPFDPAQRPVAGRSLAGPRGLTAPGPTAPRVRAGHSAPCDARGEWRAPMAVHRLPVTVQPEPSTPAGPRCSRSARGASPGRSCSSLLLVTAAVRCSPRAPARWSAWSGWVSRSTVRRLVAEARRARGDRRARAAQALPAVPPGPDARVHLLGLPGAAHHDRRGDGRGHHEGLRHPAASAGWAWLGLVQDVFAALVLVGRRDRVRHPQGASAPTGSRARTCGRPTTSCFWIAGIIVTLYVIKATSIAATGAGPETAAWMPISNALSNAVRRPLAHRAGRRPRRGAVGAHRADPGLPRLHPQVEAPAHLRQRAERVLLEHPRARPAPARRRSTWRSSRRATLVLGAGTLEDLTWKEILDTYSCTECGRCQNVCPAWNTGKPLSPKLLIMNLRDHAFEQGEKLLAAKRAKVVATARRRLAAGREGRPESRHRRRRGHLVLRDLRRVHAGVPGEHRARRPHRGHAAEPGPGRVAVPAGGRRAASQPGVVEQPVGPAAVPARGVGEGPGRRADRRARHGGRGPARVPLLGGLRGFVRRTREEDHPGARAGAGRRRACRSASSGRTSCARATRRAGWATSTCSRRSPSRTSRR